ncbi:hypothetical protein [Macrococcus sp. DPC7161]|uniref:hypothetical protein n=1 Tax=Macrococcus sp. DPC7161 TaxID=2507060 RepID=UPI0013E916C2|nr:hypothetical protein [Macrococcus sp. DPC7161]
MNRLYNGWILILITIILFTWIIVSIKFSNLDFIEIVMINSFFFLAYIFYVFQFLKKRS